MVIDCVSSEQTDEILRFFTNYGLICTELVQESHLSKPKIKIIEGNCILSACDSVYCEIFVSRRETVSLN